MVFLRAIIKIFPSRYTCFELSAEHIVCLISVPALCLDSIGHEGVAFGAKGDAGEVGEYGGGVLSSERGGCWWGGLRLDSETGDVVLFWYGSRGPCGIFLFC